jgi:hypothetical protein
MTDPRIIDALESMFLSGHTPIIPAQMRHYQDVLSACTADQIWDACLTWIRAEHGRPARTDELLDLIFGDGPRPEPGWTAPATREERMAEIRGFSPEARAFYAEINAALVAEAMGGTA